VVRTEDELLLAGVGGRVGVGAGVPDVVGAEVAMVVGVVGSSVGFVGDEVAADDVAAEVAGGWLEQAAGTHAYWNSNRSPACSVSVRPAGTPASNGAIVGSGLTCGTPLPTPPPTPATADTASVGVPVRMHAVFTVPITVS
jgi:hypothetical protein